jgi:precorrin-3B methylase
VSESSVASVVAGSIQKNCSECDHRVWVAKAGQSLLATHQGTVTIYCMECVVPRIAADTKAQVEIVPGAVEEMAEHLKAWGYGL